MFIIPIKYKKLQINIHISRYQYYIHRLYYNFMLGKLEKVWANRVQDKYFAKILLAFNQNTVDPK